ncbi:MAG: Ig-like domain-containing protein [Candidatus Eiseniibacteriota bacterium]
MRGRLLATVALGVVALSCAKVAPPPGGPEDREPPTLAEVLPPHDAAGVAPDSAVTLTFSEDPDHRSVMRALSVHPAVEFRESGWSEGRLRLVPEGGWAADRPTWVVLGGTAQDRRGNQLGTPFRTRFTTRAAVDSGRALGRVWPGREVTQGAPVVVCAYADAADSLDPSADSPVSIADAGKDGEFRLDGLDVGRRYRVAAQVDRNGDLRPRDRNELWAEAPDVVAFLSPDTNEVRLGDFLLGTLDTLGTIRGEVRADSADVAVVTTVGAPVGDAAVLPGGGTFALSVATGAAYRVLAFVDADGDTVHTEGERRVDLEEEVSLRFTAERTGVRFDLTAGETPAAPDAP